MINFMDLLGNPEYAEREIMYVIYLRSPMGVMGYECTLKIKNCDHCHLIKNCYPIMLDAPTNEPKIQTSKSKESIKSKESPKK